MNANIITDILPFDYEPVELERDCGFALPAGSTPGFPVLHARPNSGVDVGGSNSEAEPVAHSDIAFYDLRSYREVLWDKRGPDVVLATGPSSGFPAFCAGLKSGIGLDGLLDKIMTLATTIAVEHAVVDLNARAVVSVVQIGDTLVVRAGNKAAGNTLRAYASLIRAQVFKLSGNDYVDYDTTITSRRGGMRKPR